MLENLQHVIYSEIYQRLIQKIIRIISLIENE